MAVDFCIIGKRLKNARKTKGFTQEKLVEKMGVSIAYLSKVETGRIHINLERLSQICGILEVSEGEILNGVANNSSKYLHYEFTELLKDCNPETQKLIYDVAKVIAKK